MRGFDPKIEMKLQAGDRLIAIIEEKKEGLSELSREELVSDLKRLQASYKKSFSNDFKIHLPIGVGGFILSFPFMIYSQPGLGVLLLIGGIANLGIHYVTKSRSKSYCARVGELQKQFENVA